MSGFDEDDFGIPDEERVEQGLARLVAVERFTAQLAAVPWFTHLGQPLLARERTQARAYLDTLGFADAELVAVQDWEEAAAAAESPGFDSAAWDAEEQLRAALTSEALEVVDESDFALAMTRLGQRAGAAARRGVTEAAALVGMRDEELVRAAVGAAVQAAHQRALVAAGGAEPTHPFASKFALFEAGRWPIAIAGGTFHLF